MRERYHPGDLIEYDGDLARVIRDDGGPKITVSGFMLGLGPFEQNWHRNCPSGRKIRLVKRNSRKAIADAEQKTIDAVDPNASAEDRPRLRGQNAAILERLKRGPATNDELAAISRKYTSRISDIRHAGHAIECQRLGGGLTQYTLT